MITKINMLPWVLLFATWLAGCAIDQTGQAANSPVATATSTPCVNGTIPPVTGGTIPPAASDSRALTMTTPITTSGAITMTEALTATQPITIGPPLTPTQVITAPLPPPATITVTHAVTGTVTPRATLTGTRGVTATVTPPATFTATRPVTATRPGITPTVPSGSVTPTEEPTITRTPTPTAPPSPSPTRVMTATRVVATPTPAASPTSPITVTPTPTGPTATPTQTPVPVGEVYIRSHRSFAQEDTLIVVGEVVNGLSGAIFRVRVTATFYNVNDQVIATGEAYAALAQTDAEGRNPFKLTVDNRAGDISRYTLAVAWEELSAVSFQAITVASQEVRDSNGQAVFGYLRNDFNETLGSVVVTVALYDAAGQVVDVYQSTPRATQLAPGSSTEFLIPIQTDQPFTTVNVQAQGKRAVFF